MHILDYEAGHEAISEAGLSALHHALYSAIYRLANRARWAEEFEVSRELLMRKSGIGNTLAFRNAIADLQAMNLVKYNPGKGSRPTTASWQRSEFVPLDSIPNGANSHLPTERIQPVQRSEFVPLEAPTPYISKDNKTYKTNTEVLQPLSVSLTVESQSDTHGQEYKIQLPSLEPTLIDQPLREEPQNTPKKVAPKKPPKAKPHTYAESPYYGAAQLAQAFADKPWAATCQWQTLHQQMADWLDSETAEPPRRKNWKAVANTFLTHNPRLKTHASTDPHAAGHRRPGNPYAPASDYRSRKEQATAAEAHRYI